MSEKKEIKNFNNLTQVDFGKKQAGFKDEFISKAEVENGIVDDNCDTRLFKGSHSGRLSWLIDVGPSVMMSRNSHECSCFVVADMEANILDIFSNLADRTTSLEQNDTDEELSKIFNISSGISVATLAILRRINTKDSSM